VSGAGNNFHSRVILPREAAFAADGLWRAGIHRIAFASGAVSMTGGRGDGSNAPSGGLTQASSFPSLAAVKGASRAPSAAVEDD
jgi:hypothetical protein